MKCTNEDSKNVLPKNTENMRFLLKSMDVVGMRVGKVNLDTRSKLLYIFTYVYGCYNVLISLDFMAYEEKPILAFENLVWISTTLTHIITLHHFNRNKMQIRKILEDLQDIHSKLPDEEFSYLDVLTYLRSIGILFLTMVYFMIFTLLIVQLDEEYDVLPVNVRSLKDKLKISHYSVITILDILELLYVILFLYPNAMLRLYFSSLCNLIKKEFIILKRTLARRETETELMELIRIYIKLCKVVRDMDNVYCMMITLWLFTSLMEIIFFLCSGIETLSMDLLLFSFPYIYLTALSAALSLDMIIAASSITLEADEFVTLIKEEIITSRQVKQNLLSYIQLLPDLPVLTGAKLFVFDRSLICSLFGTILTYCLIVYEFH